MTRDFVSEELDALKPPASVDGLGQADEVHVEVRGICHACSKKTKTDR